MHNNKCFILMLLLIAPSALHCMDIFQAVKAGNLLRVQELINNSPTLVDARDRNGRTPLHVAVKHAHKKIIRFILQHKADINAQDKFKMTPLHLLLEKKQGYFWQAEILQIFLNHNIKINAKDNCGRTPLHLVALSGNTVAAKLLLENGAIVNAEGPYEATPLHLAAMENHEDVAHLLLQYGAPVNACDHNSNIPLHFAACRGNEDLVHLLLKYGADINHVGLFNHVGPIFITRQKPFKEEEKTPLEQAKQQLDLMKNSSFYRSDAWKPEETIKLLKAWPRYQHYRNLQIQAFRESVNQFPENYRLNGYLLDDIENRVRSQWKQDKIKHVHEIAKQEKKLSKSCIVM